MTTRLIRWTVIGVLLPVLAAAPAVAVCVECAGTGCSCCCSKQGGCQKPVRPGAQGGNCCDSPSVAPPPAAAETAAHVDPGPVAVVPNGQAAAAAPRRPDLDTACPARAVELPPPDLYTLHVAFLI